MLSASILSSPCLRNVLIRMLGAGHQMDVDRLAKEVRSRELMNCY